MDGPPTATLPSVQDWGETRPGARRWWVIWAAALATVIMVPLVTILAVAAARSGHTTARAHTTAHASTARPTTQINPEHQMPAVTWVIAAGPQQGQPPPPPSLLASAGTTVRLAEALHNGTQQPIAGATLSLSAPAGWTATPEEPATSGIIPAGGTATVIWSIAVPAAAQPGVFKLLATASCPAAAQCPTAPLTGSAVVPYASFSQAFDNVGIAPQSNSAAANLDGTGQSYSAEALAAAGYLPGAAVSHDGISFAWPDAQPGAPDNVAAQGQTFLLSATGAHLAFLGASDFGSSGGDGAIYYQDGSQQSFHLVMDDWWSNAAQPGQDEVAVSVPSFNGPPGQPPPSGRPVAVYFASIPLQAGKTVEAITLPAGSAPANGVPSLHLFAVAVG